MMMGPGRAGVTEHRLRLPADGNSPVCVGWGGSTYRRPGGVMGNFTVPAGAILLAVAVGACSSSSSSVSSTTTSAAAGTPKSGTETIIGGVTGTPVVNYINNGGKTALLFPSMAFTGLVNTRSRGPVSLGGSTDKTARHTFVTTVGNFTVQRGSTTSKGRPTPTGKNGSTCYFAEKGTYSYTVIGSQSTGKFAGAAGSGTGTTTVVLGATLMPGKTTCSVNNTRNAITKGSSITFKLSGPLTVKQ